MKNFLFHTFLVIKDDYGMYEFLFTMSLMLVIFAAVLYIFVKKYPREEVRAPLEDDKINFMKSEEKNFEQSDSKVISNKTDQNEK